MESAVPSELPADLVLPVAAACLSGGGARGAAGMTPLHTSARGNCAECAVPGGEVRDGAEASSTQGKYHRKRCVPFLTH
jgi:hypothetical protein